MMRFLKSAWVIARRDFSATVLSKTFIFFLLGPLFPLLFGGLFGSISARVATQTERPVVAVIALRKRARPPPGGASANGGCDGRRGMVKLVGYAPEPDLAAQQKQLLASRLPPIRAVLSGGLDQPQSDRRARRRSAAVAQLKMLIANARSGGAAEPRTAGQQCRGARRARWSRTAPTPRRSARSLLFLLTLMLSTMVLSQLIEEKSNKIIEVIAAAIPIDAMFVGKLFAMLAASVLGLVVWIGSGALLIQFVKHGGVATLPTPAVGWPAFLALGVIYFGMNYLLLGAAFLTIGAQASTAREVQTMSMPVTFAQVLIFGFAATAIGEPDSTAGARRRGFPLVVADDDAGARRRSSRTSGRMSPRSCGRPCGSR